MDWDVYRVRIFNLHPPNGIAMKLPMDLNNPMPSEVDQAAKLGSMAFMCTMMSAFLPSLATMNSKELVTNIIALGVLVITLVVDVCIQIHTGVISNSQDKQISEKNKHQSNGVFGYANKSIAITYAAMLLMLLMYIYVPL
uniref:Uncharacterized protein n=1 Tax=Tanacetum cinerariifolium TaxID=118510 RepID=A0A6L2JNA8_TANCI|nr:hypothetical protein CTI12_AA449360 [Tanacetum cinerariifolium]